MSRFYSKITGCTYIEGMHVIPAEAVPISDKRYLEVIANPAPGKVRSHDAEGLPILVDPVPVVLTADELCNQIDAAARSVDALDTLRALEYSLAAPEAQAFKVAGYPSGEVPRAVLAYAINGRTPQEAADSILQASADTAELVYRMRETRLSAKEIVRALVEAGEHDQALAVAAGAVKLIRTLFSTDPAQVVTTGPAAEAVPAETPAETPDV